MGKLRTGQSAWFGMVLVRLVCVRACLIVSLALAVIPPIAFAERASNCNLVAENCQKTCETLQDCARNGAPCGEEITTFSKCLQPEVMVLMGRRTANRLVLDISQNAEQALRRLVFVAGRSEKQLETESQAGDYFFRVGRCIQALERETADTNSKPWVLAVFRDRNQAAIRYHGFANSDCGDETPVVSASEPKFFSSNVKSYIDAGLRSTTTQNVVSSKMSPVAKSNRPLIP